MPVMELFLIFLPVIRPPAVAEPAIATIIVTTSRSRTRLRRIVVAVVLFMRFSSFDG
jgi:hypothetical protein